MPIKIPKKEFSPKLEKEIIRLIKEKKTVGYIASLVNTFKHVVRDIAKSHNLKLNPEVSDKRDLFGRIKGENRRYKLHEAGFYEDEKIMRLIKICKDEHDVTYDEIAKTLNRWGKRTLTGKKFTTQNVLAKYGIAKKHLS
jgi:hypothetical protein